MPYPPKTSPQAILGVALDILEQQGEQALSMRNLAERLEVKAPSLYRHFADKEALEQAMVEQGAVLLAAQLEAIHSELPPEQALRAGAGVYLEFARTRPRLYSLMMGRVGLPYASGKALWNRFLSLIAPITHNPDDTAAAVALWSFLHGFAVLERSGMFGASGPKGGFEVGLEALLKGLSRKKSQGV